MPVIATIHESNTMGIDHFNPNQTEKFIAAGRAAVMAIFVLAVNSGDIGACLEIT